MTLAAKVFWHCALICGGAVWGYSLHGQIRAKLLKGNGGVIFEKMAISVERHRDRAVSHIVCTRFGESFCWMKRLAAASRSA